MFYPIYALVVRYSDSVSHYCIFVSCHSFQGYYIEHRGFDILCSFLEDRITKPVSFKSLLCALFLG